LHCVSICDFTGNVLKTFSSQSSCIQKIKFEISVTPPGLTKSPAAAARSSRVKLSAATKAALASSARFGRSRLDQQAEQLARIEQYFGAPIVLPRLPTTRLDGDDLAVLAVVLAGVEVDTDLLTDADAGAAGATR
jgi:hypothetical protein